jgi:hypothetical protein
MYYNIFLNTKVDNFVNEILIINTHITIMEPG